MHHAHSFRAAPGQIEPLSIVMRGLDPRIHLLAKRMDCRVKPGNDVDAYTFTLLDMEGILRLASPKRWCEPINRNLQDQPVCKELQ
jgi:hypothetical protein